MSVINLEPCEQEDSLDCWWDATTAGNGIGQSFVNYDGTWQTLDLPAGHHLTGASVTLAVVDPGDYTAAEQHTFQWTTAPTTVSVMPGSLPVNLPPTGVGEWIGIVIVGTALVAMGVTAWRLRRAR